MTLEDRESTSACRLTITKTRCFLGPANSPCEPGSIRRASRQFLVLERVFYLAIQARGVEVDDLDIPAIPLLPLYAGQVSESRLLE